MALKRSILVKALTCLLCSYKAANGSLGVGASCDSYSGAVSIIEDTYPATEIMPILGFFGMLTAWLFLLFFLACCSGCIQVEREKTNNNRKDIAEKALPV